MKIPKIITPNRIRDAIVEIRFNSKFPIEVLIGLIFNALEDSYKYTNRPFETKTRQNQLPSVSSEITLRLGSTNIFYNDKINFIVNSNSIIFNCLDGYISWSSYRAEIIKIIKILIHLETVIHFDRIGLRYISDYENISLTDCVNFKFSFGMPNVESENYIFKSEFDQDNIRVIINLSSNIPKSSPDSENVRQISTIDLDCIVFLEKLKTLDELVSFLDIAHLKEKELFFTLLREDFLKTLNPEY